LHRRVGGGDARAVREDDETDTHEDPWI
jgi:hypothetical protein